MPARGTPLEKLGFLTIGLFDAANPRPGHETTLDVIALGERLAFDSVFVRHPAVVAERTSGARNVGTST